MDNVKLGTIESRFADIIWKHGQLTSGELVKICEQELSWKKSTTYTVLKKLCGRGLFQNEKGSVRPLISREDFYAIRSERFVEEYFNGSLPAFVAAFATRKTLSEEEINELQSFIEQQRKM